ALGQQLVERIAAYPAGDGREPGTQQLQVAVTQLPQASVDLPDPTGLCAELVELAVRGRSDGEPNAVVGEHLKALDVVQRGAGHHGVLAAGVVADHPAEGAGDVGGRVGPEGEPVLPGSLAQMVEDQPGLYARDAPGGVDLED